MLTYIIFLQKWPFMSILNDDKVNLILSFKLNLVRGTTMHVSIIQLSGSHIPK